MKIDKSFLKPLTKEAETAKGLRLIAEQDNQFINLLLKALEEQVKKLTNVKT